MRVRREQCTNSLVLLVSQAGVEAENQDLAGLQLGRDESFLLDDPRLCRSELVHDALDLE